MKRSALAGFEALGDRQLHAILQAVAIVVLLAVTAAHASEQPAVVSEANKNADGILVHEVKSPFQSGTTVIRVLLPDELDKAVRYPVIYVLPVEAGSATQYGDGLLEVKRLGVHNKHRAIFVAPTFSDLPWYADHPTRKDIRQEAHFIEVVRPAVESRYPVRSEASGRLLLGFSKSGWGAYSLLLRHPDLFGRAAAWDSPMMKVRPDQFGMGGIFATQENFEQYAITKLLEKQANQLRKGKRLILTGYGNFRDHHRKLHELMVELKIAHDYRDGPARQHAWGSGWLQEAVELLLAQPAAGR